MPRPYIPLLAVASLTLCCRSIAQTSPTIKDPFATDTRLERQASMRVEGLPVSEVLTLLSEKTGLSLSVEGDIGDDKVVIFNSARPLRDILRDLARLFNDAWESIENKGEAPRYRLVRTTRSRKYEDGLEQNTTRRILAQLQAQVLALSESPKTLAKRPNDDPIRTNLSNSKTRLGTSLYGALSETQQSTLLSQHTYFVRFSDLTSPQQTAVRDMFAGLIAENHAEIQGLQERNPGAVIENHRLEQTDLDRDSIRFFVEGGKSSQTLAYSLTGDLMTAGTIATIDKPARYQLPIHGNPYTGKPLLANAEMPDPEVISLATREKDWLDQLRKISEASGVPVMADFFRTTDDESLRESLGVSAGASKDTADTVSALDAICRRKSYLWWTTGKTLLLRTRTWYETRRCEIPDRWLLGVSKHLQAQGGVPTYADVLRLLELTPMQVIGLQSALYSPGGTGEARYSSAHVKEVCATYNLLELLKDNASPQGNRVPVPTWSDLHELQADNSLQQFILSYDSLTPQQRGLIPAYLKTQPHQYTEEEVTDFFALLYRPEEKVQGTAGGNKSVPIRVAGGFGTGVLQARLPLTALPNPSNPVTLSLPLSVPDDRRKNTRVELAP